MIDDVEEWRPVPSLPGLMASSWGRLLLPERTAPLPNGGTRSYKTKPTRGCWAMNSQNFGRFTIRLRQYRKTYKVHRLVCEAFHGPPPFDDAKVLHLDENSANNRPDNLKWGTQKENMNAPGFRAHCRVRGVGKKKTLPLTLG